MNYKKPISNRFDPVEISRGINIMRLTLKNKGLDILDLRECLKANGLSSNMILVYELLKANILVKKNKFFFFKTYLQPIDKTKITNVYLAYLTRMDEYTARSCNKKKQASQFNKESVQHAISLLKELGCEIYMPQNDVYIKL